MATNALRRSYQDNYLFYDIPYNHLLYDLESMEMNYDPGTIQFTGLGEWHSIQFVEYPKPT